VTGDPAADANVCGRASEAEFMEELVDQWQRPVVSD
jgi:hypothetical protein